MDNAQPTEVSPDATTNGADGAPVVPPAVPEGVQKRFDELTAQLREAERRAADAATANQQMMANFMAQQAQAQRPQAPAGPPQFQVPEGVDPALAQMFQGLHQTFQTQLQQMQQQNQQAIQQVGRMTQQTTAQMALQNELAMQPQQVQQMATQFFQQWQQQGKTGWEPKDAVDMARYHLGLPKVSVANRPLAPGGFAPLTPGGAGSPPPAVQVQGPGDRLPDAVVERMAPAARLAYEEGRMKKWSPQTQGDVPIVY
jgi:hypothetical protein